MTVLGVGNPWESRFNNINTENPDKSFDLLVHDARTVSRTLSISKRLLNGTSHQNSLLSVESSSVHVKELNAADGRLIKMIWTKDKITAFLLEAENFIPIPSYYLPKEVRQITTLQRDCCITPLAA